MGRLLKILLIIVVAIVLLVAVALFVITKVIDPNQFKPEIEKQAKENANLVLDIQGDLAWRFWPSIGVNIGRTEARIGDDEALFAALDDAAMSVAVWPLLFGRVEMDGVTLAGLELNLTETESGGNWENIGPQDGGDADSETAEALQDDGTPLDIPLTIPSIKISDGKIRYRNSTDGTDIRVEHVNFTAQDVSLDAPFPMQLSLRYQDQADMRIDLNLDTVLAADLNANHFVLEPMNLDATIAGATVKPVDISLQQKLDVHLGEDRVTIEDLLLRAAGTESRGNITITGLSEQMQFAGKLSTAPFDANKVLQAIGEAPIETRDSKALSRVSLDATLAGPAGSLMLNPLTVKLDDSTLTGNAGLESLDSGKIVFDLKLDQIVVDGYLPPADEGAAETAAATGGGGKEGGTSSLSSEPLIPVEALRPLLLDGKLTIGSMKMDTLDASNVRLAVTANNGVLRLRELSGKTLDGGFNIDGSLDVSGNTPRIRMNQKVDGLQIQPLVMLALNEDLAKGLFSMNGSFTASGNSEKALVESLQGEIDLSLADTIVRGLNLYETLVGGVNSMLGNFQGLAAALIPGQDSGKLPSGLSGDSRILDLTSKARLDKQVAYLDSLNAKLQQGEISGNGWMNTLTQDFDLRLGMQSPQLGDSERLKGTVWPLRCQGNLAGSPARWCGPDSDGFKKIGQTMLSGAARDRAQQELRDRLGIEGEGDTAKEVIKDATRQRVDQEKEKQRERLDSEVQDRLRGLFNR